MDFLRFTPTCVLCRSVYTKLYLYMHFLFLWKKVVISICVAWSNFIDTFRACLVGWQLFLRVPWRFKPWLTPQGRKYFQYIYPIIMYCSLGEVYKSYSRKEVDTCSVWRMILKDNWKLFPWYSKQFRHGSKAKSTKGSYLLSYLPGLVTLDENQHDIFRKWQRWTCYLESGTEFVRYDA